MKFTIFSQEKGARAGKVTTKHGLFETPCFTCVGTVGSIRGLDSEDMKRLDAKVLLANTYHLHLKPGEELVSKAGGLHGFMNWKGPIVTDSGGFQAFSLGFGMEHNIGKIAIFPEKQSHYQKNEKWAKVDDSGVSFRNHHTGDKIRLTPKISMDIQSRLGADIIFAFDECTSPLSDKKYTSVALQRTHKWALECLESYDKKQALFGIVQGGRYKDLRKKSAKYIGSLPFDGFGIGGSLGKSKKDMHNILDWVVPHLPDSKPRHLLGIGAVEDIFEAVSRGVDMFDCVAPTRWARRGHLYIRPESGGNRKNKFRINIEKKQFRDDLTPIDENCSCPVCKGYTKAYLRHLYDAKEITYARLSSLHNLHFMLRLMEDIRESIKEGTFSKLKKKWLRA